MMRSVETHLLTESLTLQMWRHRVPGFWSFVVWRDLPPGGDVDSESVAAGWAVGRTDAVRVGSECANGFPESPIVWHNLRIGLQICVDRGGHVWWTPRLACVDGALSLGWLSTCLGVRRR